jgi:hypothetical protein
MTKHLILRRGGAFLISLIVRALLLPYVASALSGLRQLLGLA